MGREPAELHILPTLWFRNRWSWEDGVSKPVIRDMSDETASVVIAEDEKLGAWKLVAGPDPAGRPPPLLFCDNETNVPKVFGGAASTPYPKDGVNDHVVNGAATVNPERRGTKMACWHHITIGVGETAEIRLRLVRDTPGRAIDLGEAFAQTQADRSREADEFYAALRREGTNDEEAMVMRQALAGISWSLQFYNYDVPHWLAGDKVPLLKPGNPAVTRDGATSATTISSRCRINGNTLGMLRGISLFTALFWPILTRGWRRISCCCLRANGPCVRVPAASVRMELQRCESAGQAWAALAAFRIDGAKDFDFLARVFNKLLINFTWWVNREDARGDNIFEGRFLGLDNIGPFDRSVMLPGEVLEQSDGTAWMAKFCLNMLEMALLLANRNPVYEDVAIKFFEHFALIAAMDDLCDEQDGFFYDRLRTNDGSSITVRAGLLPVFAAVELDASLWQRLTMFRERALWYLEHKLRTKNHLYYLPSSGRPGLISLVEKSRFQRILAHMLDDSEFLSPYGLRSLSRSPIRNTPWFSILTVAPAGSTTNRESPILASSAATPTGGGQWLPPKLPRDRVAQVSPQLLRR
jgi:hypothetical protein